MIEADQMVPMEYCGKTNFIFEVIKIYLNEKKLEEYWGNLKSGYNEMSQINLTLAEMGLEEDNTDLIMYEARLIGREKL